MGYIKHDAIIVTSWEKNHLKNAQNEAAKIFGPLCSDIVPGIINGQGSFFIAPDGSKEGWQESNKMDEARKKFEKWIRKENSYVDVAIIRFGGDDDDNSIEVIQYEEKG